MKLTFLVLGSLTGLLVLIVVLPTISLMVLAAWTEISNILPQKPYSKKAYDLPWSKADRKVHFFEYKTYDFNNGKATMDLRWGTSVWNTKQPIRDADFALEWLFKHGQFDRWPKAEGLHSSGARYGLAIDIMHIPENERSEYEQDHDKKNADGSYTFYYRKVFKPVQAPYRFLLVSLSPTVVLLVSDTQTQYRSEKNLTEPAPAWNNDQIIWQQWVANPFEYGTAFPANIPLSNVFWFSPDLQQLPTAVSVVNPNEAHILLGKNEMLNIKKSGETWKVSRQ